MLTDEEIDRWCAGNNYAGTVPGARRFARAIESAVCAERDKRIAELEENERAFKQVILQMQDSIDFLQKKLNASNAENRPLGYYEFDEIG